MNTLSINLRRTFANLICAHARKRWPLKGVEFKEYELEEEDFMGLNYVALLRERRDLIVLVSV